MALRRKKENIKLSAGSKKIPTIVDLTCELPHNAECATPHVQRSLVLAHAKAHDGGDVAGACFAVVAGIAACTEF